MTKSISRSQVRLIASTNAIFGADEACAMLRISRDAMYRLAKDPDDPFPIRYIGGKTRDGTRMDAYTDLLDDVVAAITGTQQDKGIESLFSLGEVGSGTVMGFNDYSLVCFAVLR